MKHPVKKSNQLSSLRGVIPLPVSLIMLILLISCSDNGTPLDPAGPDENLTFEEILARGGNFDEIPQSRSTDTLAVTEPYNENYNTQDGGKDIIERFVCTTKTLSVLDGNGKFPLFNTNADVIYPANLLQGKTLSNATPSPIPVQRAGGTISYNLNNGNLVSTFTVEEVRKSTIQDAMNNIIANAGDVVPANFQLDIEEVHSESQLALEMGIDVETFSSKVSGDMSFSSENEYNRFLVKLNQSYYTMSFDLPSGPEDLFGESVTPEDLDPYVQDDNPATFISSVTYGRIFYMLIESTSSSREMRSKLSASYGAFNNSVEGEVEVDAFNSLENVKIKVIAYGGDAKGTFQLTGETSINAIANQLAESTDIRSGLPLSYVVRSVERPDIVVGTKLATEYDVVECDLKGVLPPAGFMPLVDLFEGGIGAATQISGSVVALFSQAGTEYVLFDGITSEISEKYSIDDAGAPLGASSFTAITAAVRAFNQQIYLFNENGTRFETIDYTSVPAGLPVSPFGSFRQAQDGSNLVRFVNDYYTRDLYGDSEDFPFAGDGFIAALRRSGEDITYSLTPLLNVYQTTNYYYSAQSNGAVYSRFEFDNFYNQDVSYKRWYPARNLSDVNGFPFSRIEAASKLDLNNDEKFLYFSQDGRMVLYTLSNGTYETPWVID